MLKSTLIKFNQALDNNDLGKLILRITVGGLILFHGWHKLIGGIGGIQGMLAEHGVPAFFGYGVLIGEVVAPVLIVLGILTRPAALVLAATMFVAWLMAGLGKTFLLTSVGAWAIEDLAFFFLAAVAVALLGSGRFSVCTNPLWR
ncbi:DoxX family protein [Edaphovirga cremea]|uniref:DoxX family protein n=1 Tax=Edaphovirga cremea TaxID=2267246 RepID=UPI000DEF6C08|nr:DoxX family protein [Edaphovirga cremea]